MAQTAGGNKVDREATPGYGMPPRHPARDIIARSLLCHYLPEAFCLATWCMGPLWVENGTKDDEKEILSLLPALSFSSFLGIVMLSAVRADWRMQC